ncbi:unnamed protein product, partial [Cuscuta campestris]
SCLANPTHQTVCDFVEKRRRYGQNTETASVATGLSGTPREYHREDPTLEA